MTPDYASGDERFAEGFRAARLASGMSQEKVAERMRDLGFEMSQPVVGKIERGDRKVSVGEAHALSHVIELPMQAVRGGRATVDLTLAFREMARLRDQVASAITRFQSGQFAVAIMADGLDRSELSPPDKESLLEWLTIRPAEIARDLELENIESNVGRRVREEIEAAEEAEPPDETAFANGWFEGFNSLMGDSVNRTLDAPGLGEAITAITNTEQSHGPAANTDQ